MDGIAEIMPAFKSVGVRALATAAGPALLKLAPNGVMRAAINMSNILLVTDRTDPAAPKGVAPDMAAALAQVLLTILPCPFDAAFITRPHRRLRSWARASSLSRTPTRVRLPTRRQMVSGTSDSSAPSPRAPR